MGDCGSWQNFKGMRKVIESAKNSTVAACVSSSKERAIAYAKKYKIEHALTYDELAQNPELVDAVYICTHMNFHAKPAIMYLQKKLPCLVEKTFGVTVAEAQQMIDVAKENDTLIMEALWSRFLPANLYVQEVLNSGELGKIVSTNSRFEVGFMHGKKSRVFKKEVGGGSILDIGIYPTTYTHMLLGNPDKIEAKGNLKNGVEIACDTVFTYDCGAVANFRVSHEFMTWKEFYNIECEKGSIKVPSFFDARKITVKYADGKKIVRRFGRRGKPDGFIYEIEHFNDLIRNGIKESPVMTHAITMEVMELQEEQLRQVGSEVLELMKKENN